MSRQRVRDPLHNLVMFDTDHHLEKTLWDAVNSRPFQRLRRVKQLGFSELVYPGATHTRFSHSIGVFHTARDLMGIIRKKTGMQKEEMRESIALAAALVHDVGHGPFSHAFETVGKSLGLKLADHEKMSDMLIREGELADILKSLGSGFADDVADMIKKEGRQTVHNAVVSSQFDADRLDYMRRDRLMSGSQHSAIDFEWLIDNLEIESVPFGVDEEKVVDVSTFVIGPKAIHAAEAYVLGLFQLYPTVYFHKATRGAEKLFAELLIKLVKLVQDGSKYNLGLPKNHPLITFAEAPEELETALKLDDTVVWGALAQLQEADDPLIAEFANRLQNRKLFKCIDIRSTVQHAIDPKNINSEQHVAQIDRCCAKIQVELQDSQQKIRDSGETPEILTDSAERSPYKTGGGSVGPLERINVKTEGGTLIDLKQRSDVVRGLQTFKLNRAYVPRDNQKVEGKVRSIIEGELKQCRN